VRAVVQLPDEQTDALKRLSDDKRPPHSIICIRARTKSALLISHNTKGFPADVPDIRVPYSL
jgi:hypothetical protein